MNAEAGTEQKMRKGQERDRSGASALDVHLDGYNAKRIGKSRLSRSIQELPWRLVFLYRARRRRRKRL